MIYDILPVNNYIGNGSSTVFEFDFLIDDSTQLAVYFFDENDNKYKLEYGVDYSIEGIGNENGGFITFPIFSSKYEVLQSNQKISLELDIPASQDTQYNNSGLLNFSTLEHSFDYLTRLVQILKRKLSLCVKVEECSKNTPESLLESINSAAVTAKKNADVSENILNDIKNEIENFNKNAQITNCITEIQQRIKLELSNGALTLKKGSIVTVPNGFESDGTTPKFDYVTVQNDLSFGFLDTQSGEYILTCNYAGTSVGWAQLKHAGSGTSTETAVGHYYRTDLNKIYYQNSTSATYNAFPLGIVILEAGVPTLKQVFNGIGFIGSTIWLDKDVKLLVGDGRNDDGTLNNLEIKRATLIRVDVANWGNQNDGVLIYTDAFTSRDYTFALNFQNIERFTNPANSQHYKYDEQNNKWYFRNEADADYKEVRLTFLAKNIELENGIVKSLPNYEAFRAVDYQEVVKKSGDTINGSLFIESSNNNYGYIVKNTDYAYDELPSENHSIGTYNIVDKNDAWTTLFGFEKYTDGRNLAKVQVRGVDGTQARMQVWVDKSGNSFCSFPICTTKATTTSSASSSKIAVVVQNYVSGTSWYRVWSDGWKEQGGYSGSMPATVTLLKAFSNTNYTVQATMFSNNNVANYENVAVSNRTVNGFKIYQHTISNAVSWYACGY